MSEKKRLVCYDFPYEEKFWSYEEYEPDGWLGEQVVGVWSPSQEELEILVKYKVLSAEEISDSIVIDLEYGDLEFPERYCCRRFIVYVDLEGPEVLDRRIRVQSFLMVSDSYYRVEEIEEIMGFVVEMIKMGWILPKLLGELGNE